MRLRAKVLSGFLILALMLTLAGGWSIYQLRSTSSAVEDLLGENYRSINSGKMMLEALEREDSGVLLVMLGRWGEGWGILSSADSLFMAGVEIASSNVTLQGESAAVEAIHTRYRAYKAIWESPVTNAQREEEFAWYFDSPHRAFLTVKASVHTLINLNSDAMYGTATKLRRGADRAVMPGIVAMLAALVFSLMFSYFVNLSLVVPIVRITRGITRFVKHQEAYDVHLEGNDELSELATSIGTLVAKVRLAESKSAPNP
jgi:NtrC-family two-component system sensor histidine kinase KinB